MRLYTINFTITHKNRVFEDLPREISFEANSSEDARRGFWENLDSFMVTVGGECWYLDCVCITSVISQPIKE